MGEKCYESCFNKALKMSQHNAHFFLLCIYTIFFFFQIFYIFNLSFFIIQLINYFTQYTSLTFLIIHQSVFNVFLLIYNSVHYMSTKNINWHMLKGIKFPFLFSIFILSIIFIQSRLCERVIFQQLFKIFKKRYCKKKLLRT